MIVVDVGCHPHPPEESVYKLANRFVPQVLFGFDPHPELEEGVEWYDPIQQHLLPGEVEPFPQSRVTMIVRRRAAAFTATSSGCVRWAQEGISSHVKAEPEGVIELRLDEGPTVPAVDLPAFIEALPDPVVLKLDCEGSEFPILHVVRAVGLDKRLSLVLVEWHEGSDPEGDYYGHGWERLGRPELRCPVEEWQ